MRTTIAKLAAALVFLAGCGGSVDVGVGPPRTPIPSATPTRMPTATPSPTPIVLGVSGPGANIGFFGILRADDTIVHPSGFDGAGRPIYSRMSGSGFILVVDAKPGIDPTPVGRADFAADTTDPSLRPDLQIEATNNLGNGSAAVCDNAIGHIGGVPGINPPSFDDTQAITDALNDFGCRFDDGTGQPQGRDANSACVEFPDGEFHFVDPAATVEFCATITQPLSFPNGDTVVTARVRDAGGTAGPAQQIVIRVTGV